MLFDESPINAFWSGQLRKIDKVCMSSFVQQGHGYHLWHYDPLDLPAGVKSCDASTIVPRYIYEKWLQNPRRHTLQTFANYFRYVLIAKHGGWWVDVDFFCLKHFAFPQPYVFSGMDAELREELHPYKEQLGDYSHCVNGIFKAPRNAPFLLDMLAEIEDRAKQADYPTFGIWGTVLFTRYVLKYNLLHYQTKKHVFIPFGFREVDRIFTEDLTIPEWAYAVHLYNYVSREAKPNSLYAKILGGGVI